MSPGGTQAQITNTSLPDPLTAAVTNKPPFISDTGVVGLLPASMPIPSWVKSQTSRILDVNYTDSILVILHVSWTLVSRCGEMKHENIVGPRPCWCFHETNCILGSLLCVADGSHGFGDHLSSFLSFLYVLLFLLLICSFFSRLSSLIFALFPFKWLN